MIKIDRLTKSFIRNGAEFPAVKEVVMSIEKGRLVAVIGQSGSGKTTLFNMIAGLIKPTSGIITINDKDITTLSEKELAKYRNQDVGYILQGNSMLNNFTVLDNVCMPAYLSACKEEVRLRAKELLAEMGLKGYENEYPKNLSGGAVKRVSIARAMINNPVLLLADEPTSNLGPENSRKVMELLQKISENGTAVLVSTHEMECLEYVDEILKMQKGTLIKYRP